MPYDANSPFDMHNWPSKSDTKHPFNEGVKAYNDGGENPTYSNPYADKMDRAWFAEGWSNANHVESMKNNESEENSDSEEN